MLLKDYYSLDAELQDASTSFEAALEKAAMMNDEWYQDYLEIREKLEELRCSMIWSCTLEDNLEEKPVE